MTKIYACDADYSAIDRIYAFAFYSNNHEFIVGCNSLTRGISKGSFANIIYQINSKRKNNEPVVILTWAGPEKVALDHHLKERNLDKEFTVVDLEEICYHLFPVSDLRRIARMLGAREYKHYDCTIDAKTIFLIWKELARKTDAIKYSMNIVSLAELDSESLKNSNLQEKINNACLGSAVKELELTAKGIMIDKDNHKAYSDFLIDIIKRNVDLGSGYTELDVAVRKYLAIRKFPKQARVITASCMGLKIRDISMTSLAFLRFNHNTKFKEPAIKERAEHCARYKRMYSEHKHEVKVSV